MNRSHVIPTRRIHHRPIPPALRLVGGLALLVVIGTLLLLLPAAATRPLTVVEALFTATSALSVTGLSLITPATDLTLVGQVILMILIQIGGVGFMVVAVIIFVILGRRISFMNRIALSDSLGLLSPAEIINLTRRVSIVVLLLEALGALALYLHWREDPRLSEHQALFYAVFHAVSAFCNAGFDLFSGLPQFAAGIPRDGITLTVLGTLILVGGLGIPVIGDLIGLPFRRRLSLHTRITLLVTVLLLAGGTGGLLAAERWLRDGAFTAVPLADALGSSMFQTVAARTAGFWSLENPTVLSDASILLITALMFIGCPSASMGGGITTGTFAVLAVSLWSYARGLPGPQFAGRSLGQGTVRKAAAVLTVGGLIVGISTWLLMLTHDAPFAWILFEVVSAFATTGLSLGLTAELNLFGQLLIAAIMFWGRLGALTIIIAIAGRSSSEQLISYPEEQILIG
jgi:trk system potassium uptake protein TrkH